jgi:hypothetical protein
MACLDAGLKLAIGGTMLPFPAFVIAGVGCSVKNGFDCSDEAERVIAIGGAVVGSVFAAAVALHLHLFKEQWRGREDGRRRQGGGVEGLMQVDVESSGEPDSTAQSSDDSSSSSESLPEQERSASRSSDVDESSEQDAGASASA